MRAPSAFPAALVLVSLAACDDVPGPAAPLSPAPSAAAPATLPADPGEAAMMALEREVSGFGGLVVGADGAATVRVTTGADGEAARRRVASLLAGRPVSARAPRARGDVRVEPARWSFARLAAFRDAMRPTMALPGVVSLDADEARNRVVVTVEAREAVAPVRAAARRAGVPDDALAVETARGPVPLLTLLDPSSPDVPGGFRIATYSPYYCVLGFNVWDGFDGAFVTNSHCTTVQGGVEFTNAYQPASPRHLGTETRDPVYATGGACPAGRRCRASDAALFVYSPGWFHGLGLVARTTGWNTHAPGSITLAPSRTMSVVAERPSMLVGEWIDKVGPATGWTFGQVVATCVDVNVPASDVTLWCQTKVDAMATKGDSGAPAFVWLGSTVELAGVVWGGDQYHFWFSPMAGIETDLGPLTTF